MTVRSLWAVAGIVAMALIIGILLPKPEPEAAHEHESSHEPPKPVEKPEIKDIRVGKGRLAEPGDMVVCHYELFLKDGKKLDSTRDKKKPFRFLLGGGVMIRGWDIGLEGVREGSIRELIVPPSLGYGDRGSEDGTIPPKATLRFVVEVLKIEKPEDEPLLDPLLDLGPDSGGEKGTGSAQKRNGARP